MTVDAIQYMPKLDGFYSEEVSFSTETETFGSWFNKEIQSVNQQILNADSQVQQLAVGSTDNLHQVMFSLEKAKLSFELAMSVRNKLLEGYQEIMRMQV